MRVRIIEPTLKVQNQKKKVCAYARVSTDSEKQEESLENQIKYYENLISTNPAYEFMGVFADRGITGTTEERPEFQKMMSFCRQGKIDLIVTKSISRFARNTATVLRTVRELKLLNIEVRFEKENINTLSGDGELMLTVLSSFAQEESKNISDNIKWRMRKKFQQGEMIINTKRFLGYDKDEYGDLVINPKEAEVVKRIFNEYLAGKGCFTIARQLREEGVATVAGGTWRDSTILRILKNEKYKGDALLQKYYTPDHLRKKTIKNNGEVDSYYIEDNHVPIVSRETWEAVQEETKKRAKDKGIVSGDTKKYKRRYPLTGMLYCSKCGSTLRRRTWNSKLSYRKIVWQCSNYIKNGKNACKGTAIDDDIVSRLNIKEETIVKEEVRNGKKYYSYTSKRTQNQHSTNNRIAQKENGGILQGINRPGRTVIKL